jgi:FKBP-type peptidyl-prolyl cis-trans isomerase (trigger factor)
MKISNEGNKLQELSNGSPRHSPLATCHSSLDTRIKGTVKITQLDDDGGRKVLQIEAPWSEIESDYRDLVSQYTKVRLPGFRPGKAPQSVVEKRFKKEILDDLRASVAQRLGREALQKAGVEALGPLEASEIQCQPGQSFRALVRYLPMPEFQLPDLADLKAEDDGTDPRDRISRRLLELVPFEVPEELIRQELAVDGLGDSAPGSDLWMAAAERIRLMIILKRIARQEGIEVEENDVNNRIADKAKEFGTTKAALKKELEEGGGIGRLRDMLLAECTLDYLIEKIRGTSVE